LGWLPEKGSIKTWQISNGRLESALFDSEPSVLLKNLPFENFEFVVNACCAPGEATQSGEFGFYFKQSDGDVYLTVVRENARYYLRILSPHEERRIVLPESFAPEELNQFRFRREGETLRLQIEKTELGAMTIPPGQIRTGLFAHRLRAQFEMVRATVL
jgi:hypothetical protein